MTAALTDACTDLAAWLPVVHDLVAEPDTTGYSETRGAPGSSPPWNPAAAAVFYDIHAAIRHTETMFVLQVAGTIRVRGGSDTSTLAALDAIPRLAEAIGTELADQTARQLTALLTRILQLPAIDVEDIIRKPDAPCPRCQRKMLRYWERTFALTGQLWCGGCVSNAVLVIGELSGDAFLTWEDGEITTAPQVMPLMA